MSAIDTNRAMAHGTMATRPVATRPAATRTGAGKGFPGSGFGLFARLVSWSNVRATRNSLHRLTDRELDDIGLCRGDIEDVARRG